MSLKSGEDSRSDNVLSEMLGRRIEMVFFDDGILHIKVDNGHVYMFRWEDENLIIELYNFGYQ